MSSARWLSPVWRFALLGVAALLALGVANAQVAPTTSSQHDAAAIASGESSSTAWTFANGAGTDALPAAPGPAAEGAAGQYDNKSGGGATGWKSKLTWEAGAGFNGPIGNDTNYSPYPYVTWGGNFTLGAGLRFSKRFSTLFEYQFVDDKLPGSFLAAYGVDAGKAHVNALIGSPVFDLTPNWSNGVYVVGGWGYYHYSTNFQDYEEEESFYGIYDVPVTVASVTSNQWGGNAGFGIYHRMRGMYGDGKTQLFAEARYTYIHTPAPCQTCTSTPGFGTTELIPVTLGVRF